VAQISRKLCGTAASAVVFNHQYFGNFGAFGNRCSDTRLAHDFLQGYEERKQLNTQAKSQWLKAKGCLLVAGLFGFPRFC